LRFVKKTPKKTYILDASPEELDKLKKSLSYTNTSVSYQLRRVSKNTRWRNGDREGWEAEVAKLSADKDGTLLFEDEDGHWMYSGYTSHLPAKYIDNIENKIIYPEFKPLPWARPLPFELYEEQKQAIKSLIETKHGNVQMATGTGKTAVIMHLARNMGQAIVVTPSKDLFNDLRKEFIHFLGPANVGFFGDGKKKIGKKITVCIAKSLTMIKPGTKEWDFFSKSKVVIGDESHTLGAKTLEKTFHGLLSEVPYRFFVSGTQSRGDGTGKLLKAIIGKEVYNLTTKEGIDRGILCPLRFRIVTVPPTDPRYNTPDPTKLKRKQFLRNPNIAAFAAKLATGMWLHRNKQTLILVEELEQISMILRLMPETVSVCYAHGNTVSISELNKLGLEKTDNEKNIERFNKGECRVFIGTSCVSTGTNFFPAHNTVNWQGGGSEVVTKQGVIGRSVRLLHKSAYADRHLPKDVATIWDFNIRGVDDLKKSLKSRIGWYMETGGEVRRSEL
jgi:superfamily II DNA or RNA helicase